jgi:uncharacterized cupredoxin-like copper-binding protein
MSNRIPLVSLAALVALALAVAGCGGSDAGTSAQASTPTGLGAVLSLSADPGGQLRFTPSKLTSPKAGAITLRMANPASAGGEHGVAIEGNGVDKEGEVVAPGETSTVTADLKPGTYTYYCPVPGHRQAGMSGTLTVDAS